jgi:hypothetical protein
VDGQEEGDSEVKAIDRDRVRDLAAASSPRKRLVRFLSEAEPIADAIEDFFRELEAIRMDHGGDAFGMLLARCAADVHYGHLWALGAGCHDVVPRLVATAEQFLIHQDIADMRLRTRGKVSTDRRDLDARIRRVLAILRHYVSTRPPLERQLQWLCAASRKL